MLKNAHLLRCPAASLPRRRGNESLLIRRDATLILPWLALGRGALSRPWREAFLSILQEITFSAT
jgi:hypothetical protein